MVKTLTKHGNGLALVIDKPILKMLQVTADTPLELTSNGDHLMISPIRNAAGETPGSPFPSRIPRFGVRR
jgi:antitoxin component of MazEF toxin-antitoxin module